MDADTSRDHTGLRYIIAGVAIVGAGAALIAAAWLGPDSFTRQTAQCLFSLWAAAVLAPVLWFTRLRWTVVERRHNAEIQMHDADAAEAVARRVLADRSWQGEPAESADADPEQERARELALELLRASVALPGFPADGRRIAGSRALGWDGPYWEARAQTLRHETTTVVGGPPASQGTYVSNRWRSVGNLLRSVESGECRPAPPDGDGE